MGHIFYDFETTGLSTSYDQVLQFAAIATDENMKELPNGRLNLRCRLAPHIIPSAGALLVTGVRPRSLIEQSLSHREFMHRIEEWSLQWGASTFWGYNNMDFDENLMRQGLYQSLHYPYLTNTNGNVRADVMRLVHAAYIFSPSTINIPTGPNGKPVLKLGIFAAANGIEFDEAQAHDALYDVEKTISVCTFIKNTAPGIWEVMARNATKNNAGSFIQDANVFAAGAVYFNVPYRWVMTHCGTDIVNSAQMAAFDLSYDPVEYLDLSVDELVEVLGQKTKIIRSLKTNAQPFVMPLNVPATEYWSAVGVDLQLCEERARIIKDNTDFQQHVGEALSLRYPEEESEHIEDNIYKGSPSSDDRTLMARFHDVQPEERVLLIDQFEDNRYREIAKRLVFFETPHVLPEDIRTDMALWQRDRLHSEDERPWRTIPAALAEIEKLRKENRDPTHLQEIEDFINEIAQRLAA